SDEWNYKSMSDDILELINSLQLKNVVLLGHSMGGKTVMQFALEHEHILDKLIVVDIAPKYYPLHHQSVLEALQAIDFKIVKTRREAEDILGKHITDFGTKQFLLKNIYWKDDGELAWRFNLKVIIENIENIGEATPAENSCNTPTLFIRGEKSNYILNEDLKLIQELFPRSILETIHDAGHWVHAEKPKAFFDCVIDFVK
ncbi:MAG: alpha/beta fold hydrolase, partial [Bacteroidia bacterium]|nr:alpha/beta fold hydrolase [Bacteroidia bacterium]